MRTHFLFMMTVTGQKIIGIEATTEAFFDTEIIRDHTRAEFALIFRRTTLVAQHTIAVDQDLDTTDDSLPILTRNNPSVRWNQLLNQCIMKIGKAITGVRTRLSFFLPARLV